MTGGHTGTGEPLGNLRQLFSHDLGDSDPTPFSFTLYAPGDIIGHTGDQAHCFTVRVYVFRSCHYGHPNTETTRV